MTITAAYVQAGGYTAAQDRLTLSALLAKGADVAIPRAGILPFNGGEGTLYAQATPNMTVGVFAFQAVLPIAGGGCYIATSDAPVNVTIPAANGSNPRLDLIVLHVYDNEAGDAAPTTSLTLPGSAGTTPVQTYTGVLEVLTGSATASPVAPTGSVTSRMIVLGTVRVETGATSIISSKVTSANRANQTVAVGGILPVTAALLTGAPAYPGSAAWATDTSQLWIHDGTYRRRIGTRVKYSATGSAYPTYGTLGAATGTWYIVSQMTVPAQGFPYRVQISGSLRVDVNAAVDLLVQARYGTTAAFAGYTPSGSPPGSPADTTPIIGVSTAGQAKVFGFCDSDAAGSAMTVAILLARSNGSGTVTTSAVADLNRIDLMVESR